MNTAATEGTITIKDDIFINISVSIYDGERYYFIESNIPDELLRGLFPHLYVKTKCKFTKGAPKIVLTAECIIIVLSYNRFSTSKITSLKKGDFAEWLNKTT